MSGKEQESGQGPKAERSRMGDLLLEMGLLDELTLQAALSEQRASGRRLARILGERRVLDEERLTKAVAAKLGLEVVNVASLKIHERVLALIPASVAIKYGVLPIAIKRANGAEFLYLVMADPLDTEAIGEVQRVTGRQVRVLMASATEVDASIDSQYRAIQGKHVAPMPPATAAPPPQPPPGMAPPAPKQGNLQPSKKSEPGTTPPGPRSGRPLSSAPRASDPSTGGTTELLRAHQAVKPYQPAPPTPVPARATATPAPGRVASAHPAAVVAPTPSRGTAAPKPTPAPVARATASTPPVQATLQQARRVSKSEPFRLAAQDLIHPMPLDAPGDEPKTRTDHGAQEDWDLAVRDWSPPPSPRSQHVLSQPAGAHQVRDEPVTTEAKLLEADHDEPFELIEIESEEISTSQIELEELSEAQVIAMQAQPVRLAPPSPIELVRAFEIPVNVDDRHHPFEGPKPDDVPTGLERTGIIPAIDWSAEQFEPPPLPEGGRANRALLGGDIPMSRAAVEARLNVPSTTAPNIRPSDMQDTVDAPMLDFVAALDVPPLVPPPVTVEKKRRSDPPEKMERGPATKLTQAEDSDADAMPVIEPSSLMSLMDFESVPEDTGSDDVPPPSRAADLVVAPPTRLFDETKKEDEPTNPRIEPSAAIQAMAQQIQIEDAEQVDPTPSGDEADRDAVMSALDGQFADQFAEPLPMEQPVELTSTPPDSVDAHARGLVRALMQGRSLKSAERAELVLALGRLLVKNGVIDEEELAVELTLDADE